MDGKTAFWVPLLLVLLGGRAQAQFVNPPESAEEASGTSVATSAALKPAKLKIRLSLSTFGYTESGGDGAPLLEGGEMLQTASPNKRFFGDLRLELGKNQSKDDVSGFHLDARLRKNNRSDVQSGFRGGDEWDLRDANVHIANAKRKIVLGRQRIISADASKIDGISYRKEKPGPWSSKYFAGLYPTRGSRSLTQDYPTAPQTQADQTVIEGPRIIPAIAGAGASYAKARVHMNMGLAAIVPLRADGALQSRQSPRVFVHSSGYWNDSETTTLYHYATVDLLSPYGSAIQNLSVALRKAASKRITLRTSFHHQSTEILRQSTVNQLEDPDLNAMGLVQNSISLSRAASQNFRAAISVSAKKQRFQFTLGGTVRQRPEFELTLTDGSTFIFPTSRRGELALQMLDRRSLGKFRMGAEIRFVQGLAKSDTGTTKGGLVSFEASRTFKGGTSLMLDAAGQSLTDAGRGACSLSAVQTCYGQSSVKAVQAGGQLAFAASRTWSFIVDGHWGLEMVNTRDAQMLPLKLPSVQSLTFFARLRYRQ